MIDVVPLRYDTAFKKAFGKPKVFCQFVKDVLGIEIHVERVIAGWRYPEPVGFVDIEYDLFAEDTEKRVIVEVQHVREEDIFDRFLYYHLIALVEQVKTYTDYRFDKTVRFAHRRLRLTVYTLVVVTGKSRKQEEIPKFSHAVGNIDPVNEFGERLGIYPHRLVFLNSNFLNEKTPERVKVWFELIADSLDEQVDETKYSYPILQTVIDEIKGSRVTPQELRLIKDEAAWEQTKQNAFEEGQEKGRQQEKEEIALSMFQKGMELAQIAEITGLKYEEIEAIKSAEE